MFVHLTAKKSELDNREKNVDELSLLRCGNIRFLDTHTYLVRCTMMENNVIVSKNTFLIGVYNFHGFVFYKYPYKLETFMRLASTIQSFA